MTMNEVIDEVVLNLELMEMFDRLGDEIINSFGDL